MSEQLQYLPSHFTKGNIMNEAMKFFFKNLAPRPKVIEIGTRRWDPNRPTHHKEMFPNASEYIMTDYMEGQDVDIVSDAHDLVKTFGLHTIDAVWSSATWEHLHSPWKASESVMAVLKRGGVFFIQTHQTFPIHGYPNDYFRFTDKALAHLFKYAKEVVTCYEHPCKIIPDDKTIPWNHAAESYLNVCIAGIN